jgi:hypothetical protein
VTSRSCENAYRKPVGGFCRWSQHTTSCDSATVVEAGVCSWEIRLGIVLVIWMVLVCGVHLGRGIANVLAGSGWAFPTRVELFMSLPAVLEGDAGAGLDGLDGSCHRLQRCGCGSSRRR